MQIDTRLSNGPSLSLGHSLPLGIEITKFGDCNCQVFLKEFQTMLIETTQIRAEGSYESFDRFWLIQTTANMKQAIFPDFVPSGFTACLPEELWASHRLPSSLAPNFEICNIKKTYQLEVRLGLEVSFPKVRTLASLIYSRALANVNFRTDTDCYPRIPVSCSSSPDGSQLGRSICSSEPDGFAVCGILDCVGWDVSPRSDTPCF